MRYSSNRWLSSVEVSKISPLSSSSCISGLLENLCFGVTFISRSAIEADLAAGTVATARVEGLEPSREISLVRSSGRAETRVAQAFVSFARARLA